MSDVSAVSSYFATANEGFTTTLATTIASGATTVVLTSASELVSGSVFVGIIEPGGANQQVFTGIVNTALSEITSVVWTRGTNVGHTSGVTIVDYTTGTFLNMITAGLLKEHKQTGAHAAVTTDSITNAGNYNQTGGTFAVPAGAIQTAALAANSVTPAKMLGIDIFSYDGSLDGSAPAAGTGQFYIQAGTFTGTPSSSSLAKIFPTAFPNGLLTIICQGGDATNDSVVETVSATKTGFTVRTPTSNSLIRVNWIAIGW